MPYLTFADAFFLTCYIFTFVTMVEVTAVHIAHRGERRKAAAKIRGTARWLVPTAFVMINSILIVHFLTLIDSQVRLRNARLSLTISGHIILN